MKATFSTILCLGICLLLSPIVASNIDSRWKINSDGSISWVVKDNEPHFDHIEMSGKQVSTVVRYGVDDKGAFSLNRGMVWPLLRTIPNDTHASLMRKLGWNVIDRMTLNGRSFDNEKVKEIQLNGIMTVISEFPVPRYKEKTGQLQMVRELFPAVSLPAFLEKYTLKNTTANAVTIEIPTVKSVINTNPAKGVSGSYRLVNGTIDATTTVLQPGQEVSFGAYTIGYQPNQTDATINIDQEKQLRLDLVAQVQRNLILETPDKVINTMFAFAKVRGSESIYATQQGPLHGPGGESYYSAIWANDQAEYISPFFPYLGYLYGNESALNAYMHFARYMNPEYTPIPSSIVAEGLDYWNGAGDRGDAAMIAYGASRYVLARGDKKEAQQLWPLIEWCLEYCHRKLNSDGVVASDADELEGRFPAGIANLCTSSLYYDALISAGYLGKELGKKVDTYVQQAKILRGNIDKFFAAKVEGFDTYRYYKENTVLRAWICIPLTVGIYEQKKGTIEALFSSHLWTKNGLLTQAGSQDFWDRSTLYALRGAFASGETDKANDYLTYYSNTRLLGEHVPYAIEAWPEGGQRHLSAESGLYCRVITEGMFGIRPTGLHSFTVSPRLPKKWDKMALRRIRLFSKTIDFEVVRKAGKIILTVIVDGKMNLKKGINENETILVKI